MPTAASTKTKNAPRQKHVPQRTCVVCRETSAKRTLIRIVRTSETQFEIDPTGRANGRGAYLCDKPSCWHRAASSSILANALRTSPDAESLQRLQEFAATLTDQESESVEEAERS